MTSFQGNSAERQAREIMEQAKVKELSRIADAIFALGVQLGEESAPNSEVTYLTLANECASIGNAMEEVLDNTKLNTLEKFAALRKLLGYIRKYQSMYTQKHDDQAIEQTGNDDATK